MPQKLRNTDIIEVVRESKRTFQEIVSRHGGCGRSNAAGIGFARTPDSGIILDLAS
jgi:hypothetical protein